MFLNYQTAKYGYIVIFYPRHTAVWTKVFPQEHSPATPAEKYKGSVLGRTHAKESFTSILFIRAIKPKPPGPLPLKLHARSLWFFICFRRPYAPCLYISPPLCLNRNCAYQGTSRAKVFRQNSIAVSALSGCISSRLCTKTLLFELQKRAVLSLKHHFLRRADRSLNGASDRPLHEIEAGEGFGERLLSVMFLVS